MFCQLANAQDNELAIQAYKDAEEAFNNNKYETTISNLSIAETMLKKQRNPVSIPLLRLRNRVSSLCLLKQC